jgi:hypothetical protein
VQRQVPDLFISGTGLSLPPTTDVIPTYEEPEEPVEFNWEACDDPLYTGEVFLMNDWSGLGFGGLSNVSF